MEMHEAQEVESEAKAQSDDDAYAARGSRRWLQMLVERRPDLLQSALTSPLQLTDGETIDWRSPRASDDYAEYRDMAAFGKLGLNTFDHRKLSEFRPARGPVWDGLAVSSGGKLILIEAKAHIAEAASGGTVGRGDSLRLIRESLAEARGHFAPRASAAWDGLFYQYANRLAHLYFLRKLNKLPAHLVFVYFLNASDMGGPVSADEWRGAVKLLHAALGLVTSLEDRGVHDVFIDVDELRS